MPGAMEKLLVEVAGPEPGVLYLASVLDVNNEKAEIYLKFEDNWREEGWFAMEGSQLFTSPAQKSREELRQTLVIPGACEVLYRMNKGAPEAWYRAEIAAETKTDLFTVDLQLTPARRTHVPIDLLRPIHHPTPLSKTSFRRVELRMPENALEEATSEPHLELIAQCGRFTNIRYLPEIKSLVVLVRSDEEAHRAKILAEMHCSHSQQRQSIRDQLEVMRAQLGKESAECGNCRCDFTVPPEFLRRSVGPNSSNIAKARQLPGIVRVSLDDSTGTYTIIASDEYVLKEAREVLEFVTEVMFVEQPLVGQIIGRNGSNVQDIVRASNATLRIFDSEEELAGRILIDSWKEGCSAVVLTGFRADVDMAKMLVQYHVDNLKEFKRLEEQLSGPRDAQRGRNRGGPHEQRRNGQTPHAARAEKSVEHPIENGAHPEPSPVPANNNGPRVESQNRNAGTRDWPELGGVARRGSTPVENRPPAQPQTQNSQARRPSEADKERSNNGRAAPPQNNGNRGGQTPQNNGNRGGQAIQNNDNRGGQASQNNGNRGGQASQSNGNRGGQAPQNNGNRGGNRSRGPQNSGNGRADSNKLENGVSNGHAEETEHPNTVDPDGWQVHHGKKGKHAANARQQSATGPQLSQPPPPPTNGDARRDDQASR